MYYSEKQGDLVSSSSRTAVEDSESKPKKKEKGQCRDCVTSQKKQKQNFEGSAWQRNKQTWSTFIKKHRRDIREASHVIDDAAPDLAVSTIYDTETLKNVWRDLLELFNVNQEMVKRIYTVSITPGKTDTFSFDYSRPISSNYAERKKKAKFIERDNLGLAKSLKNATTKMMTVKELAEAWKMHENIVQTSSQFPLWWKIKKEKAAVEIPPPIHYFKQHITEKSAKYPDKRPRVVLEIAIKNVGVVGKMVAMLYSDYVPMTVKNFLAFCDPKAQLTYKGNFFYFIFPNYYCQTGDVVENRGFGGTSIYGPYFGNEDSTLDHSERGVLTMYSKIPNRNGSQFLITFRKLESLNGQNVVFGKIVKGLHILDTIESVGSKKTGRPKVEIYISDCDEI